MPAESSVNAASRASANGKKAPSAPSAASLSPWSFAWGDLSALSSKNIDAVFATATLAGESAVSFNAKLAELAKESLASNAETFKKLTSAKSLHELVELQTQAAKDSYEAITEQTSALFDVFAEGVTRTVKPISDRIPFTVESSTV